MKQTHFFKELAYRNSKTSFGGEEHPQGKRKTERPLSSKKTIHLTLKSKKAVGRYSFKLPANYLFIDQLIKVKAAKFNVRIDSYANVGNHMHFKLRFSRRTDFQNFLRSITSLIARKITGARKGKSFGKFWDHLAFTTVVTSKLYLLRLTNYIIANQIEANYGRSARELYLAFDAPRPRAPVYIIKNQ